MRRHRWLIALLIVLVSGTALAQAGSSARGQEGGMLRITLSPAAGVVLLDPAHEFTPAGWSLQCVPGASLIADDGSAE